jgi:type IV secretory pathway VirB2 component (pilin)
MNKKLLIAGAVLCFSASVLAAGGGFGKVTTGLTTFQTWILPVIRAAAVIILIFKGVQFWQGRSSMEELGKWVIGTAIIAGASELANLFI